LDGRHRSHYRFTFLEKVQRIRSISNLDSAIPDFHWKRIILARRTTVSSLHTLQHLLIRRLPDCLRNSVSLDFRPTLGQKEDCANTGEQVTGGRLRILARSVLAFVFEVGSLVLCYYAYLAWIGVSVTGSLFSDILLPVSLAMMFGLNIAVGSRWPSKERDETTTNSDTSVTAGATKKEQALKFLRVMGSLSSNQLAALLEIDVRNLSKFINPFIQTGIIATKKEGRTYIYSLKNPHNLLLTHNRHTPQEETEYASVTLPKWNIQLPTEGNVLGRLALDDWKLGDFVYLPLRKYAQKGILVSGASGSGKTIAAKVIVEELLQDKVPVLVFDYTKQWERLFQKNTDQTMLEKYRLFGMRSPKAFKGRVVKELPEISETVRTGEGTIVDLSSLSETDQRVGKVAEVLDRILEDFQGEEDSEDLKLLLVIEEAHLWTSKDVPKDASRFLDRVVRLLRKKGVGVMLVSHKISDFDPAMRSSMNISIIFRTKYEGDLDSTSRTLGSDFSKIVPSLPVGYSVFHSADLGGPFVTAWRPLYSQP
jgi:KaiC/GvpD/RAD55 family RecA-like ATPase